MPCRPAISSMSLGRAWVHELPNKLDQAVKHGFEGIEVFYEDLEYIAKARAGGLTDANKLAAAHTIRALCDERDLAVVGLQPCLHYEGLKDEREHAARIDKFKLWFRLAKILGTDIVQIPSNFLPADQIASDLDTLVADMVEVADLGAREQPPIRFAYESLCWGTYVDTWEQCWDIVRRVDRPNFGACLDTFNIAGRVYADPAAASGKTANAEADMAASLARLVETFDVSKIFYIQIVDAERLDKPLVEGHEYYVADQPARMSWSRNCRLFYGEEDRGAYLPVREVTRALLEGLKFEGWVSMELFNRSMADPSPETPAEHARRGGEAWKRLVKDFDLKTAA